MTRNLKVLGLALVAVFAFAAISASGASAETKIQAAWTATPDETVNITGFQVEGQYKFQLGGTGTTECDVDFDGHTPGKTTSLAMTPTYSKCQTTVFGISRPTTVTHNGCYLTLTVHTFDDAIGAGQIHLLCPEGKKIEIHVFNDAAHTEVRCTYTFEPQTIGEGISYANMSEIGLKKTVTLFTSSAPLKAKKSSGTLLQCGGSEFTANATGKTEIFAANSAGNQLDFELVTDNAP
jgi:hypothetical protein